MALVVLLFSFLVCSIQSPLWRPAAPNPWAHLDTPQYPSEPRDAVQYVFVYPGMRPTHSPGYPAGGAQIWPPLGVCREASTSKAVARIGHTWSCLWEWKGVDPDVSIGAWPVALNRGQKAALPDSQREPKKLRTRYFPLKF